MLTERRVQDLIQQALYTDDEANEAIAEVRTFEEEGVMTNDKGLVLFSGNGDEYQVTIVKSR